jgi:hypothetical protein
MAYVVFFAMILVPMLLPLKHDQLLSNSPADGSIFLWSIGWWAHAVDHGQLLPYTHVIFAPGGINLAWTTSIPILGLLSFPITRTFGIFATFNVLSIAAPITAGWATYLLVFRLTAKWIASLAAGFVFALAPLEVTEVALGHLNLSMIALVPVAAYLVVRQFEASIKPWVFVVTLGVVLALQAGVSTEILVTMTLFGALSMVLAYVSCREDRQAIRECAVLVSLGYGAAALMASPLLIAAVALPHPDSGLSTGRGASSVAGWAPAAPAPTSSDSQHAVSVVPHAVLLFMLLLPLVAILANLLWTRRRDRHTWVLVATAVIALFCSAGVVVVAGIRIPTPWELLSRLPILRYASPQRLSWVAWLLSAVGVGVWLAGQSPRVRRWTLGVAVVACLGLQVVWLESWTSVIPIPSFVESHRIVSPGANVAVVAGPGGPGSHQLDDLAFPSVWQVQSGFRFRLADAYIGNLPPRLPHVAQEFVLDRPIPLGRRADLIGWLHSAGVSWVLVTQPEADQMRLLSGVFGTKPIHADGVALFPVPPATPTSR